LASPEEAAPALEAITAIAEDLLHLNADGEFRDRASLGLGTAGLALFFHYLEEALPQHFPGAVARLLDETAGVIEAEAMSFGLMQGFAGVGWVTQHLAGRGDEAGEDPNAEIDEVLLRLLHLPSWAATYDLVMGLVGLGLYALERLPRPEAREILEQVVHHLALTAREAGEGITWWTPPEWLPPYLREECPAGHFNAGMAHGVPGVVALLGAALQAGVAVGRCRELLAGAVPWLLAQELPPESESRFPSWVGAGTSISPARLAWCYGDPGVAAALHLAGRAAGESSWEAQALRIARAAARRPLATSLVANAGVCHGTAGLAHIFNRLHQASGDRELGEAARSWLRRTLEIRQPGVGVGGFRHQAPDPERADGFIWKAPRGFLAGAAGTGLVLLAAVVSSEPAWDRALLLSCR